MDAVQLVFVFPKFGDLFIAIEDELPMSTIVLLGASDLIRERWPFLLAFFGGGGFLLRHWFSADSGRVWLDRMKLRLPLISDVFVQLYLVQSLRVLSLSLGNGVTIVDALHACRDIRPVAVHRGVTVDDHPQPW